MLFVMLPYVPSLNKDLYLVLFWLEVDPVQYLA